MTNGTGKSGLSGGAIGGIALGVAVVVAVGAGVVFWQQRQLPLQEPANTGSDPLLTTRADAADAGANDAADAGGNDAADTPAEEPVASAPQSTEETAAPVEPAPEVTAEDSTAPEAASDPEPVADATTDAATGTEAAAENAADAASEPAAEAAAPVVTEPEVTEPETGTVLAAPELDLVRIETDGSGVVAGSATPGAEVLILLDLQEIHRVVAQGDGSFVAFVDVPVLARPQVLSLLAQLGDQEQASAAEFILAPVPPVAVAENSSGAETPAPQPTESGQAANDTTSVADASATEAAPAVTSDTATDTATDTGTNTESEAATEAEAESATEIASAPAAETTTDVAPEDGAEQTSAQAAAVAAEAEENADTVVTAADTAAQTEVETATTETVTAEAVAAEAASPEPVVQPEEIAAADPESDPTVAPAADPVEQGVAVLRSDASGVQLVQSAEPQAQQDQPDLALDTISYDASGAVLLSGRGQANAVVRAYLDNKAIADLAIGTDGRWGGKLMDVAPGIYALRLDALDSEGKVLSRLETPFKREAPEVLQPQIAAADPAAETTSEADATAPAVAEPPVRAVTVQQGDTLWAISRARYGDGLLFVRVFNANRDAIRDPDLIYPGQVFTLPE
ncbi:LysM peptidoglycan-binding domain-containing protein [Phaeobacter sp.]|uniref:LysM peptidoglycan-binding domain-containing protein n=1 Tax=Phaeobacter sp. TaxID=1902409 RepID=UPI0025F23B23|nr:LysM peptidoglycan-binding domain-containing protein [Phaeobacter sp.]